MPQDGRAGRKWRSTNEARDKRSGKMHEFSQTNLDRGVAFSAAEAPVSDPYPSDGLIL